MYWVYKCNARNAPHQVAYGDWSDVFDKRNGMLWGSTEWTPDLESLRVGHIVIAYQTNRNEIVGLAYVQSINHKGSYRRPHLTPKEVLGVKVLPLKKSDPLIDKIDALKPGPIRTLYRITDKDAKRLIRAARFSLEVAVERAAIKVVARHYSKTGWTVKDISADKTGYDLICEKESAKLHVKVNGIAGGRIKF